MMYVKHAIEMELTGQTVLPMVEVVEGDQYVRRLELALLSNGESWQIPEDAAAVIRFQKPDGTGGEYDTLPDGTAGWSASGNLLTVTLAPQVTTCPGGVMLSVELLRGNARIRTFSILLNVHAAIPQGLESGTYFRFDGLLPAPASAKVGQYFRVAAVNESGAVTKIEAVDLAGITNTKLGDVQQINVTGKLTTDPDITIDFRDSRIQGVLEPQADTDAATKGYVDRAVAPYVVPSYWSSAVAEAAARVKANQDAGGVNCMTFALFGDLHAVPGSTTPNGGHTGALAAAVMDACRIPFAISCGDTGRMDAGTETAARESLAAGEENLSPIGNDRLLLIQGEYDGFCGTAQLSQEALFGELFRSQAADSRRVFGGDGSYFYVDYPAAKIRLILLNSCWTDGSVLPTASFGYGGTQLNWLARTALSFSESGWGVVIAAHVPPVSANSGVVRDLAVLRGILSAFAGQTSYSGTSGTAGKWDYVSVSCDYSAKPAGEIIGFFSGHSHADSIVTDDAPYVIVTVTADANLDADRASGTVTEHAMDFVTINRASKTVSLTRLGAGADRSFNF